MEIIRNNRKCNTYFESYFIRVTNFMTVYLLPIVELSFLTHVLGDMKILKSKLFNNAHFRKLFSNVMKTNNYSQ
jgi:hypothetical protein